VSVVHVGLQVVSPGTDTRTVYVQVGARASMSQDITSDEFWTAPVAIDLNGSEIPPVKVNPGGSGRFIRLRFYSEDKDFEWRISSFDIYARLGGTY